MWNPYAIIDTILITERSMDLKDQGKYVFKVSTSATKIDIARAIKDIYGVVVKSVNVMNRKGKPKRLGRGAAKMGRRVDVRRAVVTLSEGTIEVL